MGKVKELLIEDAIEYMVEDFSPKNVAKFIYPCHMDKNVNLELDQSISGNSVIVTARDSFDGKTIDVFMSKTEAEELAYKLLSMVGK